MGTSGLAAIALSPSTTRSLNRDAQGKGSNRRLEFELCAWFKASRDAALVLAMGQMMEHGLGALGRANLHPGGDGHLPGVAPPASCQIGLLPAPARKLLGDDAVGPLLGGLPVEFPRVVLPEAEGVGIQKPAHAGHQIR